KRYWAIGSSGFILNSDKILGTYKAVGPSCYTPVTGQDLGKAEDPIIWYSGGYFHVVYNFWNTRKAYHLMSKDGIHNWINTGLAVDRSSNFCRYADGTVNHWGNMERPDVYMENGHVVCFTFAVTDNNKDSSNSATAGKVLVVPFDGAKFDADSGGTVLSTGCAGVNGGKCRSASCAGRGPGAGAGKSVLGKECIDLSGRVVGENGRPRSGMYTAQMPDGRRVVRNFTFRN
ncbi:MAG TPA: hypothetical protein VMT55_02595, partial [Candidatus Sulfotelmatobacter sp.]|nr:hypothetical protein [Candidatus Sulfotelmatobacter sp.]